MRLSILLALVPAVLASPTAKRSEPAPLLVARDEPVAGKYIIKYADASAASDLADGLSLLGKKPDHVYTDIFRGFSATLDPDTLAALRDQPSVEYIEEDAIVSIKAFVKQSGATWGLGRISHKKKGSTIYQYDDSAGVDTCAYVVDTGVEAAHRQFGGRARQLTSFIPGQTADGNGHGTHVAGTIGGVTYGVAKKTKIFGVKVLDDGGSGAWSGIIAGLEFVIKDSAYRKSKNGCKKGVFANMSLGGYKTQSVNDAAAAVIKKNIFLAVAAGNDYHDDAAYYSPASEPTVCTVGATDKYDYLAEYSNIGAGVDVFAPGTDVKSAWIGGTVNTISGTSMATPHVTGLAAYLASRYGYPGANNMCQRIRTLSVQQAIIGLPAGTPNRLAFNANPSG